MVALKKILVATDFGEAADAALVYGRALARAFGAEIQLLHVDQDVRLAAGVSEFYMPADPTRQEEVDTAARARLADRSIDDDVKICTVLRTAPSPAAAIVDHAREDQVDLIIMGTRGRGGVAHLLLGSVAERVVRTAPCSVLTIHHPQHEFVTPEVPALVAKV
jgi:nucleotide-binding universal stress UspA family protein